MDTNEQKQALINSLDAFTKGYLECALWAGGQDGEFDAALLSDFSFESLQKCKEQCEKFQEDNRGDLLAYYESYPKSYAGHDLFLSRNGHGAGFFDKEFIYVGLNAVLQETARDLKEQDVVLGADGELHLEGGF